MGLKIFAVVLVFFLVYRLVIFLTKQTPEQKAREKEIRNKISDYIKKNPASKPLRSVNRR